MSKDTHISMTSNRPYLLRALYEWIVDNGLTPHILVNAELAGVQIPAHAVRNGKLVLNISPTAVQQLDMSSDSLSCSARFSGQAMQVLVPMAAILAIYAQENGQGMMFAEDLQQAATAAEPDDDEPDGKNRDRSHLQLVK